MLGKSWEHDSLSPVNRAKRDGLGDLPGPSSILWCDGRGYRRRRFLVRLLIVLTRYRSVQFDCFLEGKYGPQIESFLDECPSQFLFLMVSELLQHEVAPADLA